MQFRSSFTSEAYIYHRDHKVHGDFVNVHSKVIITFTALRGRKQGVRNVYKKQGVMAKGKEGNYGVGDRVPIMVAAGVPVMVGVGVLVGVSVTTNK